MRNLLNLENTQHKLSEPLIEKWCIRNLLVYSRHEVLNHKLWKLAAFLFFSNSTLKKIQIKLTEKTLKPTWTVQADSLTWNIPENIWKKPEYYLKNSGTTAWTFTRTYLKNAWRNYLNSSCILWRSGKFLRIRTLSTCILSRKSWLGQEMVFWAKTTVRLKIV